MKEFFSRLILPLFLHQFLTLDLNRIQINCFGRQDKSLVSDQSRVFTLVNILRFLEKRGFY